MRQAKSKKYKGNKYAMFNLFMNGLFPKYYGIQENVAAWYILK